MIGRRGSLTSCGAAAALIIAVVGARPAAQSLQFTRLGTIPGPSDLVRVDGGRAYVASAKTLTIFDVAKPEAPKKMGAHGPNSFRQRVSCHDARTPNREAEV